MSIDKKETLLTDKSFNLLKEAQQILADEAGSLPTFKTLINDVINQESVNATLERFRNIYSKNRLDK